MCALLHPDGEPLREYAGVEVDHENDCGFRMTCRVIDSADDEEEQVGETADGAAVEPNNALIETLKTNDSFAYPYEGLKGLPVKVAASTLAHRFADKRYDRYLSRPAFLQGEKLTSAEKGTALHAFMQFADFGAARADIGAELSRLTDGGYLTPQQAESVDLVYLYAFFR